jgi:hypothetical protein
MTFSTSAAGTQITCRYNIEAFFSSSEIASAVKSLAATRWTVEKEYRRSSLVCDKRNVIVVVIIVIIVPETLSSSHSSRLQRSLPRRE